MAKAKKNAVVESKFTALMRLADKLGSKKSTTIKTATEEGTISMKIDGKVCLTDVEARNQAAAVGGKLTGKAATGFGTAEGTNTVTLDGKGAAVMVVGMCRGLEQAADSVIPEDEVDEDDTVTEGNKTKDQVPA